MNLLIREYCEGDKSAIQAIAKYIWGNDSEAMKKRPSGWNRQEWVESHADLKRNNKTTLVAEFEGKVVGAGSIIQGDFPRAHLTINIDPSFSAQKEIGKKLFEALDALAKNRNFLVREWKDDVTNPLELYKTLGFRFAERCTEGWIDPNQVETSAWISSRLAAIPKEIRVQRERHPIPLAKQVEIAELLEKRARKLADQAFALPPHAISSTKRLTEAELVKRYLEGSIPDALFSVHFRDELAAAGSLMQPVFGEDTSSAHFSWGGVLDLDSPDAYAITEALIVQILKSAGQHNLRVQVEIANHHIHKYRCIHSIPGTDLVEDMVLMVRDAPTV